MTPAPSSIKVPVPGLVRSTETRPNDRWSLLPSRLAPGPHTWRMQAVDKAGNASELSPETFQLIVR